MLSKFLHKIFNVVLIIGPVLENRRRNRENLDSRSSEVNRSWCGLDDRTNSTDCKFVSCDGREKILNAHSHLMTASSSISWEKRSRGCSCSLDL